MANPRRLGRRRILATAAGGIGGVMLGGWDRNPNKFEFTGSSKVPKRSPVLRSGL